MARPYDDTLVEYNSPAFNTGLADGHGGKPRLDEPTYPDISDAEWASYCEGWAMGSSFLDWGPQIPPEEGISNEPEIADDIGADDVFIGVTRHRRVEHAAADSGRNWDENLTRLTQGEIFSGYPSDP
jgi:hypothetical protein